MTPTPLLRLMTKVARLYYEQGLRQAEIADRLDLSQSRVSRLLKQDWRAATEHLLKCSDEKLKAAAQADAKAEAGGAEAQLAAAEHTERAAWRNQR